MLLTKLDLWITLRLEETIRDVTESLEKYDAHTASGLIEIFVDDLSNWYVRRSRDRVGLAACDENLKNSFYFTMFRVLERLTRLLAPFIPFMAEMIYTNLTKKASVI